MTGRVLSVGQYLGLENRIERMRYRVRWGWVLTDSTGAEYAQRAPRYGNPMRVVAPRGLRSWDEPTNGQTPGVATPWPPAPEGDQT